MNDNIFNKQNEFSRIVKGIFVFWIFASLVTSYGKWTEYEKSNYYFGLYQFLGTAAMCLGLSIILWYKSIIGFYVVVVASFLADISLSIIFKTKSSVFGIIIFEVFRISIISLVLCIKKDGKSAWNILLGKNPIIKIKVEEFVEDEKEDHEIKYNSNLMSEIPINSIDAENLKANSVITGNPMIQNNLKVEVDKVSKPLVIFLFILMAIIITLAIFAII